MTRARPRIAALAFVCAILLLDGAADGGLRDRAAEGGAADPGSGVELIAEELGQMNPELSRGELRRIARAVLRYSDKYELDPSLVTAVVLVESSARPWARSPKGALGLMQVMPHMIRPLDMAGNPSTIETNIEAGCIILAGNIRRLGEEDGISAYFWGSDIRGVSYLNRVRAARERVRQEIRS